MLNELLLRLYDKEILFLQPCIQSFMISTNNAFCFWVLSVLFRITSLEHDLEACCLCCAVVSVAVHVFAIDWKQDTMRVSLDVVVRYLSFGEP